MTRNELRAFGIGAGLGVAVLLGIDALRTQPSDVAHATQVYVRVKGTVRTDSVRVVQSVTRVRTLLDTLNLTDTVAVRELVTRTDTLIERCLACIASASELGLAADTLTVKLGAQRRKWWDRLGVYGGYSLVATPGAVQRGVSLGVGVRLWP